jgi:hypothetical protein
MKSLHLFYGIVVVLLAACGPSAEQQATMVATALTATAAAWTLTPTATATATITPTPTLTPTPTETSTPTLTPTSTNTATKTPTATQTPDPNRYYAPDKSYSLIPPEGWQPVDAGLEYPALVGPEVGNYSPNLVFNQERYSFPMAFYSAVVQDSLAESLQNLTTIGEEFLTTDQGKEYFRWEVTDTRQGVTYHQVFYFFESGDWKLVITYSRLNSQGSENDALVDEAMKTVIYVR